MGKLGNKIVAIIMIPFGMALLVIIMSYIGCGQQNIGQNAWSTNIMTQICNNIGQYAPHFGELH